MISRWAVAYPMTVRGQIKILITWVHTFRVCYGLASITLLLAGSASALAQSLQPVRWTLSASCRDYSPTSKCTAVIARINATMDPGWHVYALNQGPGGPDPMRISVPRQAFVMDGDIDSPTSKRAFDPNFGIEVRYYEDEAAFTVKLKQVSETPNEPLKVLVDVSYQACTREMCMPPKVAHLSADVSR